MKGDYSRWNPPKRRMLTLRKPNQDSLAAMQERIDRQHRFRMMKMRNGPGAGGGGLSQHPGSPISPLPPVIPPPTTTGLPPTDITISPTDIPELRDGAVIGVVTVTDADLPNDYFFYTISDGRFEIVDGVFKLKSGSQMVFANEQSVILTFDVTDSGGNPLSKALTFTVTEQIVPPGPNQAPTDVQLDNHTISDTELGAVVGNVTALDPDLPDDTVVITVVGDPRFVVIPTGPATGQLRLTPDTFVSHLLEPQISVTLRVTDAGGLTADRTHVIDVNDIAPPDLTNGIFVGPAANGAANGTSFANCYGFASLNTVIGLAASAGKQVLLGAHLGNFPGDRITITRGGSNGAPVIIRGVDAAGNESSAEIVGTRATNGGNGQWAVGGAVGSDVFKFAAGAGHLFFKNINGTNIGNGLFNFTDNLTDITIDTVNVTNCRRFIENALAAPATTASVTALRVRNVLVQGFSKGAIHLRYTSTNFSFENVVGDSLFQDGDNFASGVVFDDTASDGDVVDCLMRNCIDASPNQGPPQTFYNGDGFAGERNNSNIRFLRCNSTGNTDAGFDFKGNDLMFTDCGSAQNKANFKLWGTATLLRCHGYDPRHIDPIVGLPADATEGTHQIEPDSATANIIFTDCTFVDADPNTAAVIMFTDAGAGTITTVNTSIQKDAAVPMIVGTGTANLDTKTGPVFTVNPTISAIATAGETCTATPGAVPTGVSNAFQWLRRRSAATYRTYIDDAVSAGYTATADDVGCTISFRQFTTDANGYMTEATSVESAVITASGLVLLTPPIITGPLGVGGILDKIPGTYSGLPQPTLTYDWEVALVSTGETNTHTNVTGDIGSTVTIVETADNGSGPPIVTRSAAVGPIVASLAIAYVAPAAAGIADGSNFANAIAFSAINSVVAAMSHPGLIYVASHLGNYTGQYTITHGGSAVDPLTYLDDSVDGNHADGRQVPFFNSGGTRSPVELRGVNAALVPTAATFTRGRTLWTRPYEGTVTDPFTTQAGSAVVNCFVPAHKMDLNTGAQSVLFRDQTAVGGITISGTTYYAATIVDVDNFTITHTAPASSAAGPGGGVCRFEAVISTSSWAIGTQAISLGNGASNLKLSYLNFERCGEPGAVSILSGANLTNLEFDHCTFYNCRRFLEMSSGAGTMLTYYYVHDCGGVGGSKSCIRFRNGSSMGVFEDIDLDGGRQDRDNYGTGIEINTDAFDVAIRRANIRAFVDSSNSTWNGDGIASERTNHHILIEDYTANGMTDGAVDSKSDYTMVRRATVTDCKNDLKLWGHNGILVDGCALSNAFKRGGVGGSQLYAIYGSTVPTATSGSDTLIKDTTFSYSGSAANAISSDDSNYRNVITVRQLENTFTNCNANSQGTDTALLGADALMINGLLTDVTAPTITASSTANAYSDHILFHPLTASEGVSWAISGGADQALFSIVGSNTLLSTPDNYTGQYLKMVPQTYTGIDDIRVVTVRATDAARNETTDFTITVTVVNTQPAYTFRCRFEGVNNATTATDEAGGKTITFVGNAKLTTTSPIEGVSSLLLDGNGDYCQLADHADWQWPKEFSVLADVNLAALPAAGQSPAIISQYDSSGGQTSAMRLYVTSTGAVSFNFFVGSTSYTTSPTGLPALTLAVGVPTEVAVSRDSLGKVRLFLGGTMVGTITNTGNLVNGTPPLRIGFSNAAAANRYYINGRIDDVRIWKDFAFCTTDAGYTP